MKSSNSGVYINQNTEAYKEFMRMKERKKLVDNRINSLESQIKELLERVATLEQSVAKSREET
jgi:prefoldin subunit 5